MSGLLRIPVMISWCAAGVIVAAGAACGGGSGSPPEIEIREVAVDCLANLYVTDYRDLGNGETFVVSGSVASVTSDFLTFRPVPGNAGYIVFDDGDIVSAGGSGVFRSQDGGATYQPVPGAPATVIDAIERVGPTSLLAFASNGTQPSGLWRSDDQGATWSQLIAPDADHMAARGGHVVLWSESVFGIYVSTDGGLLFAPRAPSLQPKWIDVGADGMAVAGPIEIETGGLVGTSGFALTLDDWNSYAEIPIGVEENSRVGRAVIAGSRLHYVVAYDENVESPAGNFAGGEIWTSNDRGATWTVSAPSSGRFSAVAVPFAERTRDTLYPRRPRGAEDGGLLFGFDAYEAEDVRATAMCRFGGVETGELTLVPTDRPLPLAPGTVTLYERFRTAPVAWSSLLLLSDGRALVGLNRAESVTSARDGALLAGIEAVHFDLAEPWDVLFDAMETRAGDVAVLVDDWNDVLDPASMQPDRVLRVNAAGQMTASIDIGPLATGGVVQASHLTEDRQGNLWFWGGSIATYGTFPVPAASGPQLPEYGLFDPSVDDYYWALTDLDAQGRVLVWYRRVDYRVSTADPCEPRVESDRCYLLDDLRGSGPGAFFPGGDGSLYVVRRGDILRRAPADGAWTVVATGFLAPSDLVVEDGVIYVLDGDVFAVVPDGSGAPLYRQD